MISRLRNNTAIASTWVAIPFALLALLATLVSGKNALATPIFGERFYYEGGPFELTVLQNSAGFTSEIFLVSKVTNAIVTLASTAEVGKVVSFASLSALGYRNGDPLIVGIRVINNGNLFFMGPASSNPDNFVHASFEYLDYANGRDFARVGFEDLWGGGDKDYDDAVFRVIGVGLALQVPEPAGWLLIFFGLAALLLWRMQRVR